MEEQINTEIQPLSWEASEFEVYQRDWKWYAVFVLVVGGILAYFIYTQQWLLAGVTVAMGLLLLVSGRLRPRQMSYRIDGQGVYINGKLFAFEQLKSFWLHDQDGKSYLNVISAFRLMPTLTMRINAVDKETIKSILGKFLPESGRQSEDWIDKMNRFLRV